MATGQKWSEREEAVSLDGTERIPFIKSVSPYNFITTLTKMKDWIVSLALTFTSLITFSGNIKTDQIDEVTAANGVVIDGVTIKDGGVVGDLTGTVLTATQATINHDSLANYVAAQHIDWTSTSSNLQTSGSIQGGTITDGTASLTNGAWTGITTLDTTGDCTCGGDLNVYSSVKKATSVSVSAVATTICAGGSGRGGLFTVIGVDGSGNNFTDLVCIAPDQNVVGSTVFQSNSKGSPASRTYTYPGDNIQLAMGSGTYTVYCHAFVRG